MKNTIKKKGDRGYKEDFRRRLIKNSNLCSFLISARIIRRTTGTRQICLL